MSKFIHLHTHSHYSLLDGLSKVDALVARAKELGMEALALTDHGNIYGAVEFYKKCQKAGIKAIIGVETYVAKNSRLSKNPKIDNVRYHLTMLAKNEIGYKNLCALITKSHLEGFYYKPRIDKELLEAHKEGLIILSGCFSGEIGKMLHENRIEEAEEVAKYYHGIFKDDYYIEIQPEAPDLHDKLIALSKKLNIPLVATGDSHYLLKEDAPVHDVLLAIQTGSTTDDEDRFTFSGHDASFRSTEEMAEAMKHVPESLENTVKIAEKCIFKFELGKILIPKYDVPDGKAANAYLRELIEKMAADRYPKASEEVRDRMEYEISIIEKMGFADYFLIVQDFVNWAKGRGIVVGPGRGSAAGSIVSYILKITDIDPLKYNLFFERFLNPMRISMPDIDLDFSDLRRDEVLGYLKDKYGEERVAQIITFGTMAARASVRDAGRALGLSYAFCDKIAKLIPMEPNLDKSDTKLDKYIEAVPELKAEYETNADAKKLLDTAKKLEGVVRHASVHACGTVVSREPLVNYMALQRSPQDETATITQFEMHSVEDLGLLKVDLLGLKTLTIIEETLRLLRELHGVLINISNIPLADKKTFKLLQTGETIGVFQFESSGMKRYMKEIKPTELGDLVALVALYRPGPIELIPSYIKRKHGQEKIEYIHPVMENILKETYGVIVYQEQVMAMATEMAGLSKGEGYLLIKAVGKKIKSLLDEQKEKFISNSIKNNIAPKVAEKAWELIEPFARYGFNKAHSVCYAMIGYQTAYLKANYPVEFMTAVLNNASDDIERIAFIVGECKRMGIEVLPPDINKSVSAFVPDGPSIRFGISAIKNVGENITGIIVEERLRNGQYAGLEDFTTRIAHRDLNKKSMEALIKGGAIDSLGVERMTALENLDDILKLKSAGRAAAANSSQTGLFGSEPVRLKINLRKAVAPAPKAQKLAWEKELLGLYITDHPLKDYDSVAKAQKLSPIGAVLKETSSRKTIKTYGLISSIKRIQTKNGDPMLFAKIEDLSDTIEVLVFKDVLRQNLDIWTENNIVEITGRISKYNGEFKIICSEVRILKLQESTKA